jgi:hypothetical protein
VGWESKAYEEEKEMGCCASMSTGFNNVSLSTTTGYQSVMTTPAAPVRGTKAVVGLLVLNLSGTATVTLTLEVSYDGGMTFKSGGNTTATAVGPKELTVSSIDAGVWRLKAEVSGTTVWVLLTAMVNWSTP